MPSDKKPNIVFLFVDNLGFGELGCYGGGIVRGGPDPQYRSACGRRCATHQHEHGSAVHPIAFGGHDRSNPNSFGNRAYTAAWPAKRAYPLRSDPGRTVVTAGIRHSPLRQMALGRHGGAPTPRTRIRRMVGTSRNPRLVAVGVGTGLRPTGCPTSTTLRGPTRGRAKHTAGRLRRKATSAVRRSRL